MDEVEAVVVGAGVIGLAAARALMLADQGEAEDAGAFIAFRAPVLSGRVLGNRGFELSVDGQQPTAISCRILVNAAGLHAPALARAIDGVPPESIPTAYFCRGVY